MSLRLQVGYRRGHLELVADRAGRLTLRWDGCGHESTLGPSQGRLLLRSAGNGQPVLCRHPSCPPRRETAPAPAPAPAEFGAHLTLWTAGGPVAVPLAALVDEDSGLADPPGGAYLLDPCAEGDELDAAHDAADALARSRDPAERAEGERRQAVLRGLEDERAAAILRRERGLAPDAELPPGALDAARRRTT